MRSYAPTIRCSSAIGANPPTSTPTLAFSCAQPRLASNWFVPGTVVAPTALTNFATRPSDRHPASPSATHPCSPRRRPRSEYASIGVYRVTPSGNKVLGDRPALVIMASGSVIALRDHMGGLAIRPDKSGQINHLFARRRPRHRPRAGRLRAALARRPAPRARLTVRAAADDPLRLRHESPRRDHRRRSRPQAAQGESAAISCARPSPTTPSRRSPAAASACPSRPRGAAASPTPTWTPTSSSPASAPWSRHPAST